MVSSIATALSRHWNCQTRNSAPSRAASSAHLKLALHWLARGSHLRLQHLCRRKARHRHRRAWAVYANSRRGTSAFTTRHWSGLILVTAAFPRQDKRIAWPRATAWNVRAKIQRSAWAHRLLRHRRSSHTRTPRGSSRVLSSCSSSCSSFCAPSSSSSSPASSGFASFARRLLPATEWLHRSKTRSFTAPAASTTTTRAAYGRSSTR